jgi:hypothetical protein
LSTRFKPPVECSASTWSRDNRDATVTVHQLIGLLDNRDVEAALKRIDLRNTFELVSVET